jgi:hypothetical protein
MQRRALLNRDATVPMAMSNDPLDGASAGLAISDADGSDGRAFGFAASGPWHPGSLVEDAPSTVETPAPV